MSRREPGFRAAWPSVCRRCGHGIRVGQRVVTVGRDGDVIHVECASGQDDE